MKNLFEPPAELHLRTIGDLLAAARA